MRRAYVPRQPERTVLHRVVREHLETFLAEARHRGGGEGLPLFVEREFREFLTCGVLARGFARFRCDSCKHEILVPFSCKGRGFCQSCCGRRMAELSAHLADGVLGGLPVRQWVLTLPHRLRYALAWDHRLCRAVLAVFARAVLGFERRRARRRGIRAGVGGAVTNFLAPQAHRRLLAHVLACRDQLEESGVIDEQGNWVVDRAFRRSHTLTGPRLEEVWSMFPERLRGLLPGVRRALGMPWFPLGKVERQLAVHDRDGFFALHVDTGDPAVAKRRSSCVYYFHRTPRRYAGGELRLYDTWVTPTGSTPAGTYTDLAPIDNSAVFFRSDAVHAVCPVRSDTGAFGDGRFAVTIWFWEGEWPAGIGGAPRSA